MPSQRPLWCVLHCIRHCRLIIVVIVYVLVDSSVPLQGVVIQLIKPRREGFIVAEGRHRLDYARHSHMHYVHADVGMRTRPTNIIVVVEWGTRIGKVVDISGISILPWWLLINRFIA